MFLYLNVYFQLTFYDFQLIKLLVHIKYCKRSAVKSFSHGTWAVKVWVLRHGRNTIMQFGRIVKFY